MIRSIYLLLALLSPGLSNPVEKTGTKIGCLRCHPVDTKRINVHLVPHSHDDVGWLKTVHQYYYGERNDIQRASVKNIIDSMIDALAKNPDRRFIQVETAFFWEWWTTQEDESRRELFKSLVDNGQLEIVNGAWSMNDEACAHYQSIIDQYTWGLRAINDTIGECGIPRSGWQIDPFGHSREQASLLAQMGYDGVFFARLHATDKETRQARSALDLAWQGSVNLDDTVIFTGIFPTGSYYPPRGHCYDSLCSDRIRDDPKGKSYNLESKVKNLKDQVARWAKYYPTNNILITMGGDFQYQKAEINFINMDKLIKGMKNDPDYNVIYSTPSCYIQAVYNAEPKLELQTEDFFPYREDQHTYWTGYFTSRPNSKRFERMGHNILQSTKQLMALSAATSGNRYEEHIKKLREVMGIMQHHDAITGTERQHVADDYVKLLTDAIRTAESPMEKILNDLLRKRTKEHLFPQLSSCLLANVSVCTISQSAEQFLVVAYNPLAWSTTHYVRLPVQNSSFQIVGPDGDEQYDLVESYTSLFGNLQKDEKSSMHDLVFAARQVPPLGLKLYHVTRTSKTEDKPSPKIEKSVFTVDPKTNLLKSVTLNGITLQITQNFFYYIPSTSSPNSGAYLFRPKKQEPEQLTKVKKVREFKGKLVHEFQQHWETDQMDLAQSIRWYKDEEYLEFDWIVGHLDKSKAGKEVITRFKVDDFDNNGVFFTDSNGREIITRTKDKHPGFYDDPKYEPVTSNYYPITSMIMMKDEEKNLQVAVLNDRAQGGSSLQKNHLELMIHRRLLRDDAKGVVEHLDEKEFGKGVYARGSHYLIFGKAKSPNQNGKTTTLQARILAQKKLLQPWVGLAKTDLKSKELKEEALMSYSAMSTQLTENINILTLEPWKEDSILLRLEHILEKSDDPVLQRTMEIDLEDLFKNIKITKITELTLGANQKLSDKKAKGSYSWKLKNKTVLTVENVGDTSHTRISLTPMKIRTFAIEYTSKSVRSNKMPSIQIKADIASDAGIKMPDAIQRAINGRNEFLRDTYIVIIIVGMVALKFFWSFRW